MLSTLQWGGYEAEGDRPFPIEDLRVTEGTQTSLGITQEKGKGSDRKHRMNRDTFTNSISALIFLSWKELEILYSLLGNRHISRELPPIKCLLFCQVLSVHLQGEKSTGPVRASQSRYLNKKTFFSQAF